ncbi:MAG: hypothetical protein J6A52_02625 [Bacilli bacterium]|nr:hypothetical protein [Bacilli bacterium]
MNEYLIPANSNRGKLILGYFRPIDLIIFAIGMSISLILLLIFNSSMDSIPVLILILLPGFISIFLVVPIPYQHNILVLLGAIYNFYFVNRQRYYWRGWCMKYGEEYKRK